MFVITNGSVAPLIAISQASSSKWQRARQLTHWVFFLIFVQSIRRTCSFVKYLYYEPTFILETKINFVQKIYNYIEVEVVERRQVQEMQPVRFVLLEYRVEDLWVKNSIGILPFSEEQCRMLISAKPRDNLPL
jgi:hypothetical protein